MGSNRDNTILFSYENEIFIIFSCYRYVNATADAQVLFVPRLTSQHLTEVLMNQTKLVL